MNEIEQLRADTATALALLTQAVCEERNARRVMDSLLVNARVLEQAGHHTHALQQLTQPMLLAASSAALKQFPDDPHTLGIYRLLRGGQPQ